MHPPGVYLPSSDPDVVDYLREVDYDRYVVDRERAVLRDVQL